MSLGPRAWTIALLLALLLWVVIAMLVEAVVIPVVRWLFP